MATATTCRGALYTAILFSMIGLAGCSSPTTGTPAPVSSAGNSGSAAPATSGSSAANALDSLDACSLLTDQEAAQFKPNGSGQQDTTGAASSGAKSDCEWIGRSSDDGSMAFGILVRPTQGIDSVNTAGGQYTKGNVAGRPAGRLASTTDGSCLIALAVSSSSRVDVSTLVGVAPNSNEACQVADTIAGYVSPRLPAYHD